MSRMLTPANIYTRKLGLKEYELKDHLGNVRGTISDIKNAVLTGANNTPGTFTADITSLSNYYAFGMKMPGRTYNLMTAEDNGSGYRFGFNGKEQDFSFHNADGQIYDYGFRMYDARLCRFMSVDPLTNKYPWWTPYQFAGNSPIKFIDIDGLEPGPNRMDAQYDQVPQGQRNVDWAQIDGNTYLNQVNSQGTMPGNFGYSSELGKLNGSAAVFYRIINSTNTTTVQNTSSKVTPNKVRLVNFLI